MQVNHENYLVYARDLQCLQCLFFGNLKRVVLSGIQRSLARAEGAHFVQLMSNHQVHLRVS